MENREENRCNDEENRKERGEEEKKTRPSFVSLHKRDETRRVSLPDRTSYVWNSMLDDIYQQ
jgi:hypothetical protein